MDGRGILILICSHLVFFAAGCWTGERSLRRYKNQLYRQLYSGSHFQNPLRRKSWK